MTQPPLRDPKENKLEDHRRENARVRVDTPAMKDDV
jgi:hypothetical protein